jgi:hypothetical protein
MEPSVVIIPGQAANTELDLAIKGMDHNGVITTEIIAGNLLQAIEYNGLACPIALSTTITIHASTGVKAKVEIQCHGWVSSRDIRDHIPVMSIIS